MRTPSLLELVWPRIVGDYVAGHGLAATGLAPEERARLDSIVVPPDQVDFTPYWKRPIPPSYFPD